MSGWAWYIAFLGLLTVIGTVAMLLLSKCYSREPQGGIEEVEERLL